MTLPWTSVFKFLSIPVQDCLQSVHFSNENPVHPSRYPPLVVSLNYGSWWLWTPKPFRVWPQFILQSWLQLIHRAPLCKWQQDCLPGKWINDTKLHLPYPAVFLFWPPHFLSLSSPAPVFSAQVSRLHVGLWMSYFHPLWCCSVWLGSFLWGPMLNLTSWQGQLLKVPLQCLPGLGDLLVATGWTWHESHLFAIPVSPCLGSLLVLLVLRTELWRCLFVCLFVYLDNGVMGEFSLFLSYIFSVFLFSFFYLA